jgi:hypothetical protein
MDIDDIDDPFAHGACVRPSLADPGAGVNLEGESDEDRGQVDPDELGDNQSESSGVVDDLLGGDGAPNLVSDAENEAWVALQQEEFETGAPPGMHAEGSEEPPGDDVQVLEGFRVLEVELDRPRSDPNPPDLIEVARAASITNCGYVNALHEPWKLKRPAGRLGAFDTDRVSMKCYYHSKCSLVRKRSKMSDEDFKRWLFSADIVEETDVLRREAGLGHMQLGRSAEFQQTCGGNADVPPASSAGAAASSSSGSRAAATG